MFTKKESERKMFESIIEQLSASVPLSDTEYIENGLLHCKKCGKPTETIILHPFTGEQRKVRIICDCRKKDLEAHKEQERAEGIYRQKHICFAESNMISWTFENDDRKNEKLSRAMQNYVRDFADYKKQGKGLLLHGPCGTGKTYLAACIANALIENGYTAYMTDFVRLSNMIFDTKEGKQAFIDALNRYSLLILDDLGVERTTEYMKETVYNIINTRYKAGLPFIVTTNLSMKEIIGTQDISNTRTYDRIIERCIPVEVVGVSRRRQGLAETLKSDIERLGL